MLPRDGFLGAEGGFRNSALWRPGGNAAEVELLAGRGVHRAEKRADVVHAAYVVENDADRELRQPLIRGGGSSSKVGKAVGHSSGDLFYGMHLVEPDESGVHDLLAGAYRNR